MENEYIKHIEGMDIKCFLVSISNRIPHLHRDMEILFILDGSVIIKLADSQHILKKNDIFLIERNEIHSLFRTEEDNLILALQFDVNFCKSYFPAFSRIHFLDRHIIPSEQPAGWDKLKTCIKGIIYAYSIKQSGYPLEIMNLLNSLCYNFITLCRHEEMNEDIFALEERQTRRLSRIVEHIHSNYMNKVTLTDLAKKENLDMYYLSHFIKKSLGMSFQQYLNKVRLDKATELMLNTNKRKLDICLESGFSDYRYLTKAFLKEYGCSPAAYKVQYKNHKIHLREQSNDNQHIVAGMELAFDRTMSYLK